MTLKLTRRSVLTTAAAVGLTTVASPWIARAANTFDVQMLNKHPENKRLRQVFFPRLQVVEPGDSVRFLVVDKGHNTVSTDGMLPEGSAEWKGKVNEEVTVTFDQPGLYGYHCTPHLASGMVGLVAVKGDGMMANLEAAQSVRQRGKAKKIWEDIWAELGEMDLATS
ncbi:MAG: pseudoazurin [Pseudomonadota bacterium]